MRKFATLFLGILLAGQAWATDFESNGLYYRITSETDHTVMVIESDYSSLTAANIPEKVSYGGVEYTVTSIDKEAFYYCESITSVTIPSTIQSIGYSAFYQCTGLTTINFNATYCAEIGQRNSDGTIKMAFVCPNVTTINIGDNVQIIPDAVFQMTAVTSITIPSSVTTIGKVVFGEELTSLNFNATNCTSVGSWVNVDEAYYSWLFDSGKNLTTVNIGDNVQTIPEGLFAGSGLTSITIPNSVTSIGKAAFWACDNLESIVIGNSVTSIGERAFLKCSKLKSITIPESVTSFGENVFYRCENLTTINFNATNCTQMGTYDYPVFIGCQNVTTLNIGDNVQRVPNYAFSDLIKLEHLHLGNSIQTIGEEAFSRCASLTSIVVPNSTTYIGKSAFAHCYALKSLTIGESVKSIGESVINECNKIDTLYFNATNCTSMSVNKTSSLNGSTISTLIIGDNVENIPDYAFMWNGINSIYVGNSIKKIGDYSFYGQTSLGLLVIPNSIESIGKCAFGSSGVRTVTIPNTVKSIGESAFDGTNHLAYNGTLEGYPWGANHTNGIVDGDYIYSDNTKTKIWAYIGQGGNVTIPNTVTSIGRYAFGGADNLNSVTIPNSVTEMETSVFSNCRGLKSVTLPNSITSIENNTFSGCVSLKSINFPESVTKIKGGAFSNCTGFMPLIIPNSVVEIGEGAFYNVKRVEYGGTATGSPWGALSVNGAVDDNFVYADADKTFLVSYIGSGETVIVPNTVTRIGERAFYRNTNIKMVSLPNSLTEIGEAAFGECTNLTTINLPNSITSIEDGTFQNCVNLESVDLPEKLTRIGECAFSGCYRIDSVCIPNTIEYVGAWAFNGCAIDYNTTKNGNYLGSADNPYLVLIEPTGEDKCIISSSCKVIAGYAFLQSDETSIVVPSSVRSICLGAFYDCNKLTSITLSEGVKNIGTQAFGACAALKNITIPSTVTQIGEYAFSSCSSLESITIPEGITSISDYTFFDCPNLASVSLPNSLKKIGNNSFEFSGLKSVTIPNSVTSIGECAFRCTNLTSATFGNSIIEIGGYSFESTGLKSVTIPNSVTSIGRGVFSECTNLASVVIGNSLTDINENMFKGCTNLTSVVLGSSVKHIDNYAFFDCTNLSSLSISSNLTAVEPGVFGGSYFTPQLSSITITSNADFSEFPFYIEKDGFEYHVLNKSSVEVSSVPNTGNIVVPSQITAGNTYTVIGIGELSERDDLTSITIPNTVTTIKDNAFADCSNLTSVSIPNSVTSIGTWAFGSSIENLTCGSSAIGTAFCGNNNLKTVIISDGCTAIPDNAFSNCYGLESVTISNSVTSIGNYAFSDCYGLESVSIPNSVTSIGAGAFYGCYDIEQIAVPQSVSTIGEYAFSGIEKIVYEGSATGAPWGANVAFAILDGDFAFSDAEKTHIVGYFGNGGSNVVIPNTATRIDSCVFGYGSKVKLNEYGNALYLGTVDNPYMVLIRAKSTDITSCSINNKCKVIADYAFCNCGNLTSVTVPNSVLNIGKGIFEECHNLQLTELDNALYLGNTDNPYLVLIKADPSSNTDSCEINTNCRFIYDRAFEERGYESVKIPNSVTSIGDRAFLYAYRLKNINIPNSVTSIGELAFGYCQSCRIATIPNTVKTIGDNAFVEFYNIFYNGTATGSPWGAFAVNGVIDGDFVYADAAKTKLVAYMGENRNVEIPNSVVVIGESAFAGRNIESVTIPNSVTEIGNSAFSNCTFLKSISIPNAVTTIGENAFHGCYKLVLLNVPNTVASIGFNAFYDIADVIYDGSATGSPWGAHTVNGTVENGFVYADSEKKILLGYVGNGGDITIPNTVVSICDNAFADCDSITSVTMSNSVTSIGDCAFRGCNGLTSVILSESISKISRDMFSNCPNLTSVNIPNSVTTIGVNAFWDCGKLNSITIPESVTSIGSTAFGYCRSLTSVIVPNSVIEIGESAFFEGVKNVVYNGNASGSPWGAPYINGVEDGIFVYSDASKTTLIACSQNTGKVTIPNNVTHITSNTLYSSSSDKMTVVIPNSVKIIDNNMFNYYGYSGNTILCEAESKPDGWDDNWYGYDRVVWHYNSLNVTVTVNDSSYGTVSGTEVGRTYAYGETITLTAIPNEGCNFVNWGFEPVDNPYTLTITQDMSVNAYFERIPVNITASSNNNDYGYVNGGRKYYYGDNVTLNAEAYTGYHFVKWSDNVTDATRQLLALQDSNLTAIFEKHTIVVDTAVTATCTKAGLTEGSHCSVCNSVLLAQETIPALGHTEVVDAAVATTCTEAGLTEGSHCSVCNAILIAQDTIAALGHTEVVDAAIAATCTESGLTEGSHCSVCNVVLVAQDTLAALGHTEIVDAAVAATCTEAGKTEGKHCSVCNAVIVAQTEIPALGHEFVNYVYNNDATTTADGTETATCGHGCGATDTRVAEGTKLPEDHTAVSESAANAINIYAHDNTIVVENATDDISVYDAMGRLVDKDDVHIVSTKTTTITINTTGIYIVKTGNTVKRVMIK